MSLSKKIQDFYGGRSYDPATGMTTGINTSATGPFGTFSKEDEARFNAQMAQAQTLAELEIMEYQNEYNSPAEQAKRMRQAGLNPDLLGIENHGSADASAGSALGPQGSNPSDVVSSIASTAFNAFNTAMSVINGMQSFRGAQEALAGQQIDNINKMDGFVLDFLLGSGLTPASFTSEGDFIDDKRADLISSSRSWAEKVYGLRSRQSRIFQDSVTRRINDPRFVKNFYESLNSAEKERQEYISKTTGDLYDQQDSTMRILIDELVRLQNSAYKESLKAGRFESEYNQELYDSLDGSSFADYHNMMNVNETAQIRTQYYQKAFGRNVRKRWYNAYKNGNFYAGLALSFLNIPSSIISAVGSLVK